nr:hypothetical protein [Russula griseocarnosa]
MNLSTNKITYLNDVSNSVNIDMSSSWTYHYFNNLDIYEISTFLRLIKDDKIYLLIPLFGTSKLYFDSTLVLAQPFLVDNKSNPVLITKFILDQWNSSGFGLKPGSHIYFSFKFKRVWYSYK